MNSNLLSVSVISLGMAIVMGVIVLYLSYFFTLKVFEKKGYAIEKNNTAFGIFVASIMLSAGLIMSRAFESSINIYDVLQSIHKTKVLLFLHFIKYFLFFIGISIFSSTLIIVVSMKFYNMLTTDIKELKEISENNISVAIIAGVAIFVVSYLSMGSISTIIESLIPYPKFVPIR